MHTIIFIIVCSKNVEQIDRPHNKRQNAVFLNFTKLISIMTDTQLQELYEKAQTVELSLDERKSVLLLEHITDYNSDVFGEGYIKSASMIDKIVGYKDLATLEDGRNEDEVQELTETIKCWGMRSKAGFSSHYEEIKQILRSIDLKDGDTFIDVGSSYGRVGSILGVNFPNVNFIGYEIVKPRLEEAQRIAESLQLKNVKYVHANLVLETFSFQKANWFLIYNIFDDDEITTQIIEKIAKTKEKEKEIHLIVKYTGSSKSYTESPFLELVGEGENSELLGSFWIYRFK